MEVTGFSVLIYFNQELFFYFSSTVFAIPIMQGCDNVQEDTIPSEYDYFYSQSTGKQRKQPE